MSNDNQQVQNETENSLTRLRGIMQEHYALQKERDVDFRNQASGSKKEYEDLKKAYDEEKNQYDNAKNLSQSARLEKEQVLERLSEKIEQARAAYVRAQTASMESKRKMIDGEKGHYNSDQVGTKERVIVSENDLSKAQSQNVSELYSKIDNLLPDVKFTEQGKEIDLKKHIQKELQPLYEELRLNTLKPSDFQEKANEIIKNCAESFKLEFSEKPKTDPTRTDPSQLIDKGITDSIKSVSEGLAKPENKTLIQGMQEVSDAVNLHHDVLDTLQKEKDKTLEYSSEVEKIDTKWIWNATEKPFEQLAEKSEQVRTSFQENETNLLDNIDKLTQDIGVRKHELQESKNQKSPDAEQETPSIRK